MSNDVRRVEKLVEAGRNSAKTSQGRSQIDSFTVCTQGYAEPGYSDPASGIIVFGNFNAITKYTGNKFITIDDAPARLAKLLEKLGVELEWSDEWTTCNQCGRAVRTKPDSYSWQPSYSSTDDGITCHECVEEDPTDYLQSLEGDDRRCVTLSLDLEAHGYRLLADDFENGFYGGQADRPELIAEALREQGVERFIFKLDSTGQFDMSFSVWVHEDEFSLIDMEQFEESPTAGVDPADGLRAALADASRQMDQIGGQIKVAMCDVDSGTAKVRTVTPQEFVEGRAFEK
jgi:hypothetical protein